MRTGGVGNGEGGTKKARLGTARPGQVARVGAQISPSFIFPSSEIMA